MKFYVVGKIFFAESSDAFSSSREHAQRQRQNVTMAGLFCIRSQRRLQFKLVALLSSLLFSCGKSESQFKNLPIGEIRHDVIVLAKVENGAKARGFSEATPPGTRVKLIIGEKSQEVVSNDDGSFIVDIPSIKSTEEFGEFVFTTPKETFQQTYALKTLTTDREDHAHPNALERIAKKPFATEKEIDAVELFEDRVLILSSQASSISAHTLDDHFRIGKKLSSLLLNEKSNAMTGPRMIKATGKFITATLFNSHELVLVDREAMTIVDRTRLVDEKKQLLQFEVNPPLSLKAAMDVEETGKSSQTITKTIARNAEAIIALDDNFFLASFVNYFQYADPSQKQDSVVGPGIVALMMINDDKLITKNTVVLPYKNPSFFLKNENAVFVLCSGSWQIDQGNTLTSKEAGIARLSTDLTKSELTVLNHLSLENFAPAEPAMVRNKIIIPHSYKNEIAIVDDELLMSERKRIDDHGVINFTFARHWRDDVVFLGDVSGSLIAYSLGEGYFPFPFTKKIVIDAAFGDDVPLYPNQLIFRTNDHYAEGYTAWVVTAFHKIYPLDFLSVFGP